MKEYATYRRCEIGVCYVLVDSLPTMSVLVTLFDCPYSHVTQLKLPSRLATRLYLVATTQTSKSLQPLSFTSL